jgi:dienelactone hydrolase
MERYGERLEAISPDFYAGISENEAGRLPGLSDARVMEHIDAALTFLADDPCCDGARVVVFGVCRSGSWGLLASASSSRRGAPTACRS